MVEFLQILVIYNRLHTYTLQIHWLIQKRLLNRTKLLSNAVLQYSLMVKMGNVTIT